MPMLPPRATSNPLERFLEASYWLTVVAALGVALLLQLARGTFADFFLDALIAVWSVALYFFPARRPHYRRFVHTLGLLPLFAYYVAQSHNLIPASYRSEAFAVLAIFPINVASLTLGLPGALAALAVSAGTILYFFRWPDPAELFAMAWLLSALLGVSYHELLRRLEVYHERLHHQALRDALTGLGNRRAMEEDFARMQGLAQRTGRRLVLTLWDLDDLKGINDRHGHQAGDQALRDLADALRHSTRRGDGVYRTGGDEFAGLHLDLRDPEALKERVRERFADVSVGWIDATAGGFEAAFRAADERLYREKAHRNHAPG
ncbi:GGDEF domain-containing protein [Oceanithermus sp.]|uniref:GGDEF domain-containing protein n=1 Tax=Oceanithermus sp. TaxID=2268145 RepID=UPI002580B628|nr:GGDEF domain-containing protein [Oceanithermus sp.]